VFTLDCSFSVHLLKVAVSSVWSVEILELIAFVRSFSMSFMICSCNFFASTVGGGDGGGLSLFGWALVPSLFCLLGVCFSLECTVSLKVKSLG